MSAATAMGAWTERLGWRASHEPVPSEEGFGIVRLIIAGSRKLNDAKVVIPAIAEAVGNLEAMTEQKVAEVVSGCARGIDTLGEKWAHQAGLPVKQFPANWGQHGRAAGPIRNRQMAANADALLAVWDGKSKGTANMILEAELRGLHIMQVVIEFGEQPHRGRSE
jgi:hypothetical protein